MCQRQQSMLLVAWFFSPLPAAAGAPADHLPSVKMQELSHSSFMFTQAKQPDHLWNWAIFSEALAKKSSVPLFSSAEEKTTPRLKEKATPVFAQIQINKVSTAHAHLYCFEPGIRSHGNGFWLLGSLLLPRQLVQLFWALFFLIKRKNFTA